MFFDLLETFHTKGQHEQAGFRKSWQLGGNIADVF